MEFSIKSGSPEKQRSACVVAGVFEPRKLSLPAQALDRASDSHLSEILRRGDMEGKLGSTLLLHNVPKLLCDRVLLVGLGKEREFKEKAYGEAVRAAIKTLNSTGSMEAVLCLTELSVKKRDVGWNVFQAAMAALETVYRFERLKSRPEGERRPLRKLTLLVARRSELGRAEQ
ncbi:MAG TPA: M17 family peptidase N-terminal domain-containing protein, partial [Burkholderiales bacterium]|nr:M17 family peptidase N-terminal domain-containing protein [Burkholderiales bacterium]